jgi:arsenate reductase
VIKLYGLKNCDTCRKALKWLKGEGIQAELHDFRKDGLEAAHLEEWLEQVDWEILLNRKGTTWRSLNDADKLDVDREKVKRLMLENPSLIKRPVFELGDRILVGFKDPEQQALRGFK